MFHRGNINPPFKILRNFTRLVYWTKVIDRFASHACASLGFGHTAQNQGVKLLLTAALELWGIWVFGSWCPILNSAKSVLGQLKIKLSHAIWQFAHFDASWNCTFQVVGIGLFKYQRIFAEVRQIPLSLFWPTNKPLLTTFSFWLALSRHSFPCDFADGYAQRGRHCYVHFGGSHTLGLATLRVRTVMAAIPPRSKLPWVA